jgi:hypothetical protein
MKKERLSLEDFDNISKANKPPTTSTTLREKRKSFEKESVEKFNFKKLALIGSIFVAMAGTGAFFGIKSKVDKNINQNVNIEYTNTSESKNQKPNYSVEQVPLPVNLPYTDKGFVKFDPQSGKDMLIKRRGDKSPFQVFLYKANTNSGEYFDKSGSLYFLDNNKDGTFTMVNKQEMNSANKTLFIKSSPGSMLIPSPNGNIRQAIKELSEQGYEVEAVIGTGAIRKAPKNEQSEFNNGKNKFVAQSEIYKSQILAPNGELFFRNADGTERKTNMIENGIDTAKAGYYTKTDGSMYYINLDGKSNAEVKTFLEKLRADKTVLSYSLNGWANRQGTSSDKPSIAQARFAMIFDQNGKYISSMVTPPIGFLDALTVAQVKYGKGVKVVHGDGDFYAGALSLDKPSVLFKPEMYFVGSGNLLVRRAKKPIIHTFSDKETQRLTGVYRENRQIDKIQNTFQQLPKDPSGTIKKIITHVN